MTDGYSVYMDVKRNTDYRNTVFQRRCPWSDECNQFALDDTNIEGMVEVMEKEKYKFNLSFYPFTYLWNIC